MIPRDHRKSVLLFTLQASSMFEVVRIAFNKFDRSHVNPHRLVVPMRHKWRIIVDYADS